MAATSGRKGSGPRVRTNGNGVPQKLNRKLIATIADVIGKGNYIETAVALAGVNKETFYTWLKLGRKDEKANRRSIHRELVEAVELAAAEAEAGHLALIDKAAEAGIWTAAAWRLERRMPDKYGRRSRVDHGTPDGQPFPMRIDIGALTDEELDTLQQLLQKGKPADGGTGRPRES